MGHEVWYASYGSNMCRDRLLAYLLGGRPEGARRSYVGSRTPEEPADDITLSTASGRDSAYVAVHMFKGTPYQAYFTAAERIFTAHEGRPHWGKVHTRDAEYFAGVYPRFGEFTALRNRLDPDRRFQNDYLRRVLGA